MNEITDNSALQKFDDAKPNMDLIKITDAILFDTKTDISTKRTLSMPIAELAVLGSGVSSLIPTLNTITQTVTVNTQGLYRLVNAEVDDVLKPTGKGDFWAALKKIDGNRRWRVFKKHPPYHRRWKPSCRLIQP